VKYNISIYLEYTSHTWLAKMAEEQKNMQLCSFLLSPPPQIKNTDKMYIALAIHSSNMNI